MYQVRFLASHDSPNRWTTTEREQTMSEYGFISVDEEITKLGNKLDDALDEMVKQQYMNPNIEHMSEGERLATIKYRNIRDDISQLLYWQELAECTSVDTYQGYLHTIHHHYRTRIVAIEKAEVVFINGYDSPKSKAYEVIKDADSMLEVTSQRCFDGSNVTVSIDN